MKNMLIFVVFTIFLANAGFAADLNQTIRGYVVDAETKQALPGATVVLLNTNPVKGAVCDKQGAFKIKDIKVGRYSLKTSYLGYNPKITSDIIVVSGKESIINIELKESSVQTQEIVIKAGIDKNTTLNEISLSNGRTFSVEESGRYAGGMDDPLRAAASFAGAVRGSNLQNNEIIVRGNSPKGLLWRLEGADIPNPNHFGRIGGSGGGLTIFSSHVLANSDFFTAAFPAEYGNALAGVFDINFRNGNDEKNEYAFQFGIQGIDLAAEGPMFTNGSSFLVNYRYSTIGLVAKFVKEIENTVPTYQDLSFKLNMPTSIGRFSLIGIGGIGLSKFNPEEDTTKLITLEDREKSKLDSYMGALILKHNINIGECWLLNSNLSVSANKIEYNMAQMKNDYSLIPKDAANYQTYKIAFSTGFSAKLSKNHFNKTGFSISQRNFNINVDNENPFTGVYSKIINDKGNDLSIQFFSQSKYEFSDYLSANFGARVEYLNLNDKVSVEPRASFLWKMNEDNSLGLSYGLHSQKEEVGIYLSKIDGVQANKKLDFAKAHHLVLSYDLKLGEYSRLKIEPYVQKIFDVPVIAGNYYSILNTSDGYISEKLVNTGEGLNYGLDLTLEKFLENNWYYLTTVSVFKSKYKDGVGIERNGKFDATFAVNFLLGKEFYVTENNIIGINLKANANGGQRYIPVNLDESVKSNREILDYNNAYSKEFPNFYFIDLTVNYRMNYSGYSGIIALQISNLLGTKDIYEYRFNPMNNKIEGRTSFGMLPYLSFKLEF